MKRVTGLPRPLPECTRCQTPIRRARATVTRNVCRSCLTPAEAIAAKHREIHVERLAVDSTTVDRRVNARIDQLAAKRAARAAR